MPGWGITPAIRTNDLATSFDFYTNTLGFTVRNGSVEEGHIGIERGDAKLMLERPQAFYSPEYNAAIAKRVGTPGAMTLYAEAEDLEELFARAQSQGARIIDPLADRPWGQAEFTVEDPDGTWLSFWKALG